MNSRIAIFPGTFDPFHIGHKAILERASPLFNKIIIAIGTNTNKKQFFPVELRKKWIKKVFENDSKIIVEVYDILTVDFCKQNNAMYILRGIRTASDFEYERAIAQMNKKMYPEIESLFLLTTPDLTPVKSSIVRDIIRHGGDASEFIPKEINPKEYKLKNADKESI